MAKSEPVEERQNRRMKAKQKIREAVIAAKALSLSKEPQLCTDCRVQVGYLKDDGTVVLSPDGLCGRCRAEQKRQDKLTDWHTHPEAVHRTVTQERYRQSALSRQADRIVVTKLVDRRGIPVVAGDVLEERVEKGPDGSWDCRYWVVVRAREAEMAILNRASNPDEIVQTSVEDLADRFAVVDNAAWAFAVSGGYIKDWRTRIAVHPQVWERYTSVQ
jgi:hypothetical protein